MDRRIAELYSQGVPAVTGLPEYRREFLAIFRDIEHLLRRESSQREAENVGRREFI